MDPFTLLLLFMMASSPIFGGALVWSKWGDIKIALQGKKIAILGAPGTGKTTMFKYITEKILPEQYKQTLKPHHIKSGIFRFDDLKIVLKKSKDVAGNQTAMDIWRELFMEADLVFYMIRSDELLNKSKSILDRAAKDLELMVKWDGDCSKNKLKKKLIFLVGNHWTTDQRFERAKKDNKLAEYEQEFTELLREHKCQLRGDGKSSEVKVVVGCLGNETDARHLIVNILTEICNK